jgi:hypothetical protein
MDYELAKQLKDAGFKQKGVGYDEKYNMHAYEESKYPEHVVTFPTLSELIEACGDEFFALIHEIKPPYDESWFASTKLNVYKDDSCWGTKPEIAVAKLWLYMNKKKNDSFK